MITKNVFLYFAAIVFLYSCTNKDNSNVKKRDYVSNEATAIKIAEAIWLPIYGEGIYNKRPFIAKLTDNDVWVVYGTLPDEATGGVPYIEIQKKDCKILKVTHGK